MSTRPIVTLFALLTLSCSVFASEKENINTLLDEFLLGASWNDPVIHDKFWDDELVYTSSSGVRFGKQTLMDGVMASGKIKADKAPVLYTAEEVQIRIYDDIAVVTFELVGTGDSEQKRYLNSGTLQKKADQWKVINWQATIKSNAD